MHRHPIILRSGSSRSPQAGFLPVLLILVLTLVPLNAFSQGDVDCNVRGDILFSFAKPISLEGAVLLDLGGPWFRDSGCLDFPKELTGCASFYAAKTTPSSPFGLWVVSVDSPVAPCPRNGSAAKFFCINKPGFVIGSSVNIVIRGLHNPDDIEISGKNVTIPPDQAHP